MIKIKKITDDNFEIIICGKSKGILNSEELFKLMWLADLLGYKTRDK